MTIDCAELSTLEASMGTEFVTGLSMDVSEMMWADRRYSDGEEGEDGFISILDIEMIDVCNHVAVGSFWAKGVEYAFEVENGNNNGFVWRSISADGPIPDIVIEHTSWALAPKPEVIEGHLERNTPESLLILWDAFLKRPEVADLCRSYSYDRMFQPGVVVEDHYRKKASKMGFVILPQEHVDEVRANLERVVDERKASS